MLDSPRGGFPGGKGEKGAADVLGDRPRYDLLNRLLSFGADLRWRRRAVDLALEKAPRRILDLATGTGDLALMLKERAPGAEVVGADFAPPMLAIARRKAEARGPEVRFLEADALALPFPDGAFDAVTIAFGFRNFADYEKALRELYRVLAPGGGSWFWSFPRPLRGPLASSTGSTSSGSSLSSGGLFRGTSGPTATFRKAWRPSPLLRP